MQKIQIYIAWSSNYTLYTTILIFLQSHHKFIGIRTFSESILKILNCKNKYFITAYFAELVTEEVVFSRFLAPHQLSHPVMQSMNGHIYLWILIQMKI